MSFQAEPSQSAQILDVIRNIFQLIAWPTVVVLAFKLSRWLTRTEIQVKETAETLQTSITTIMTNHLPHLQKAVEDAAELEDKGHERIVDELKELRADIRAKQ